MKSAIFKANLFFLVLILFGCEDELLVRQDALTPYAVSIEGTWELYSISRNGMDLTGVMDLTDSNIEFNGDGTFSLSSASMPFPTLRPSEAYFTSGGWSFNNDYQPTELQFSDGSARVPVKLDQPLYGNNNTTLALEFSLGCSTNTYVYQFKKK